MRRRGLVLLLLLGGCAESAETAAEAGCAVSAWPDVEASLYVAAECPAEGADGSKAHPFTTVSAALEAAPDGATIAVAAGTYPESLRIERPVHLVGAVDASRGIILKVPSPDAAGIILQVPAPDALGIILKSPRPDAPAITVAASGVELVGLRIEGAHVAGVEVLSGAATLADCRIESTVAVDGAYGSGVVARPGSALTVRRSAVLDSAGAGVFFDGASGAVEGALLQGNAAGGLRAAGGELAIILQDSEVTANVGAGVLASGARGIILKRTAVTGTTADPGFAAHGVVATALDGVGASVRVEDGCALSGNAGVGVLVDGASSAVVDDTLVSGNERGGVWLQKGAGASDAEGVAVTRSTLADNGYVGVVVTRGAALRLEDCTVMGTQEREGFVGPASVKVGDGVSLVAGSRARIESNDISDNARLGILADGIAAVDLSVSGNSLSNHPVAIILQHPKGAAAVVGDNSYADNKQDVVNAASDDAVPVTKDLTEGIQ